MAKVVLSGYYGFDNIGDEAILYSIIQALRDSQPEIEITVLSHNPDRTKQLYNVAAVNRWQFKEVTATLRNADLLISGGGSLLQDVTGLKSLGYYLGVIALARSLDKPVFFYAQGIGPVNSSWGRRMMRQVVNRVQAITVRDEASKEDLLAMGVTKPPITVTTDPVLGIKITDQHRQWGQKILQDLGMAADKPILGISIRNWQDRTATLEQELARCADHFIGMGWQVLFLPLHYPDDQEACCRVANIMERSSARYLVKENYTVTEFMGIISQCQLMVGMRLHAIIMAAAAGVPLVGVSYDPKIDRFMQQLGSVPAGHVTDQQINILPQLELVANNLPQQRQDLEQRVAHLKASALSTARLALATVRD
ncbi:polysaccharide pyruvyl transferase CsaB [Peptococcaceae bacterium 1198_IL3148]